MTVSGAQSTQPALADAQLTELVCLVGRVSDALDVLLTATMGRFIAYAETVVEYGLGRIDPWPIEGL